jgi:site-specific DNA-methyltransferase (adenine-specific)
MPFGIRSYERGLDKKKSETDLTLHSSQGIGFVSKDLVTASFDYVEKYNVITGKAISGHLGETDENGQVKLLATTKVIAPYEIATESYLAIGKFDTQEEATNLLGYMKTKFMRFLLLQGLTSMNITKERFLFVPLQDFSRPWTDADLYAKYGLTEEEIAFIEKMIKPM